MAFKKILCPIDFSTTSQQAMRTAIRLANEHAAELVLVHTWSIPATAAASEFGISGEVVDQLITDAQSSLDAAVAEAARIGAARVASKLLIGVPWQQVVDLAERDPAFDLIVIGTHGRTGGARILLGSVAEAVVRHAPCPVLTVRGTGEPSPFANVLCPVDFSDSARDAVNLAADLVGADGAITLAHVVELPIVYGVDFQIGPIENDLTAVAARQLERWRADLAARTSAKVTQIVRTGRPGAQLLDALGAGTFDLVVMGSHGRTGIARVLLGSVAEKLVRHAGCSVLVTHRRR